MDPEEKKRISNEKRLNAIKQWKQNRNRVQNVNPPCNVRKILDTSVINNENGKLKLFDSDDEEEVNYENDFRIRPQFEGPHGQQLLEMSSKLSGRFKLDERFKEDFEPENVSDGNDERERNLKIVQSVLGYDISTKSIHKRIPMKRQIRFDPKNENSAKYIKVSEASNENSPKKKTKNKKEKLNERIETEIPVSTERYVEISSNFKEILNTASSPFMFNFSEKFNNEIEQGDTANSNVSSHEFMEDEIKIQDLHRRDDDMKNEQSQESGTRDFQSNPSTSNIKPKSFFIYPGDPRLTEGVKAFRRQKSLEEIKAEWPKKRRDYLDYFKRLKKSKQWSRRTKVKTTQMKNAIRKQNYRN